MLALQGYVDASGLDHKLLYLVKMHASQINGCAYCIDMHTKDARAQGETEQRLYALDAWRETPFYSDRERAALEWTEAVTNIREGHAPDASYEAVDLAPCRARQLQAARPLRYLCPVATQSGSYAE